MKSVLSFFIVLIIGLSVGFIGGEVYLKSKAKPNNTPRIDTLYVPQEKTFIHDTTILLKPRQIAVAVPKIHKDTIYAVCPPETVKIKDSVKIKWNNLVTTVPEPFYLPAAVPFWGGYYADLGTFNNFDEVTRSKCLYLGVGFTLNPKKDLSIDIMPVTLFKVNGKVDIGFSFAVRYKF